jgi:hypothetical protein
VHDDVGSYVTHGRHNRVAISDVEIVARETCGFELTVAHRSRIGLKRRVTTQWRHATQHVHQIDPDLSCGTGNKNAG